MSICSNTIDHYENRAQTLSNRYETADVERLQTKLLYVLSKCTSVLEIGCGSGRDASFLKEKLPALQLTATDGSKKMVESASLLHPELVKHLKCIKIPRQLLNIEAKFDGVYSIATLMHLNELEITETLANIAELLNTRGILFISVCTGRGRQREDDKRTFTLRTAQWWMEQLRQSGFLTKDSSINSDGLKRDNTIWLSITAIKDTV